MGSDETLQTKSYDLSLSPYETAMEALSSLITRQKRGDMSNMDEKYGKLDRMRMYVKVTGFLLFFSVLLAVLLFGLAIVVGEVENLQKISV